MHLQSFHQEWHIHPVSISMPFPSWFCGSYDGIGCTEWLFLFVLLSVADCIFNLSTRKGTFIQWLLPCFAWFKPGRAHSPNPYFYLLPFLVIMRNRDPHRENVENILAICLPILTMQHIREYSSASHAMRISAWNEGPCDVKH